MWEGCVLLVVCFATSANLAEVCGPLRAVLVFCISFFFLSIYRTMDSCRIIVIEHHVTPLCRLESSRDLSFCLKKSRDSFLEVLASVFVSEVDSLWSWSRYLYISGRWRKFLASDQSKKSRKTEGFEVRSFVVDDCVDVISARLCLLLNAVQPL